jgi:hypothetical protein
MAELMKALGKIIICMDKEFIHGVMVGNTKGSIIWTRNMAMESTTGLMVEDMKDTGLTVSNTEKENIFFQMELLK